MLRVRRQICFRTRCARSSFGAATSRGKKRDVLPKEVQEGFHYDAENAAAYSAAQNAAMQKNSEQLAKEYAGVQWTREQQQNIQALRVSLQLLQNAKEDLQREIGEKEKLPRRLSGRSDLYRPGTHSYTYSYSYDNPARAD